jgi:Lar family restriction alleviation protein
MSKYIKSCPFCGSNKSHYEELSPRVVVVQCDDCNAHGTTAYNKIDALKNWNTRIGECDDCRASRVDTEQYHANDILGLG